MSLATTHGRGVGFPFGLSPDGRIAFSLGPAHIEESLRLILATDPGERVMLPSFGAGLRRFLFEPNVPATHRLIEESIRHAVHRWEPRVRLETVRAVADELEPDRVVVELLYRLVADDREASLGVQIPVAHALGAGTES